MVRRTATAVVLWIAILGGSAPHARDDVRSPIPLSLVVTDARGEAVRNLSPADLEISEGGERRAIASLTLRGPAPRVIGLLLDEFHVSPEHSDRVRRAALAFLDAHVRAGDTVYVMLPLDPHSAIRPVASIEDARARITSFAGRRGDFTPRTDFEAEYMSAAGAAAERQRAQVARSALEALAIAMREPREASKALIVVTEGFRAEERSRTRMMTLRTTTRAAALASIPVYVADPSMEPEENRRFNDLWRALAAQTGGALFTTRTDLAAAFSRIGADLRAQYLVQIESSGKQDGGFHDLHVKPRRAGVVVRGPSGYWAPFAPSRFAEIRKRADYSTLLTPHVTGLIQPWFRMSPGEDGRTRVTFMWTPRRETAATVQFAAISFEGVRLHEAPVPAGTLTAAPAAAQTTFEVPPGPLQVSMAVSTAAGRVLDTEVRYIDIPKFDGGRPVVSAVEFIRPRSLPEFSAMQRDPYAVPTAAREFLRQDRLLVRVRAFSGTAAADVQVRLLNSRGEPLLELPALGMVDDASQFDLPFARFARGDYYLEVRASNASETIRQLITLRLIG